MFKTFGEFQQYVGRGLPSNIYGVSSLSEASDIEDSYEQQNFGMQTPLMFACYPISQDFNTTMMENTYFLQ